MIILKSYLILSIILSKKSSKTNTCARFRIIGRKYLPRTRAQKILRILKKLPRVYIMHFSSYYPKYVYICNKNNKLSLGFCLGSNRILGFTPFFHPAEVVL